MTRVCVIPAVIRAGRRTSPRDRRCGRDKAQRSPSRNRTTPRPPVRAGAYPCTAVVNVPPTIETSAPVNIATDIAIDVTMNVAMDIAIDVAMDVAMDVAIDVAIHATTMDAISSPAAPAACNLDHQAVVSCRADRVLH